MPFTQCVFVCVFYGGQCEACRQLALIIYEWIGVLDKVNDSDAAQTTDWAMSRQHTFSPLCSVSRLVNRNDIKTWLWKGMWSLHLNSLYLNVSVIRLWLGQRAGRFAVLVCMVFVLSLRQCECSRPYMPLLVVFLSRPSDVWPLKACLKAFHRAWCHVWFHVVCYIFW